jgi:phytoene dehydrogenase-like protein
MRSAALTLPGFIHDVCSSVHPLGMASPFFRRLPLTRCGLAWVEPELPLAHPLDDGGVAVLGRSLRETAEGLGGDARAYERLMSPLISNWEGLTHEILRPILHWPEHPRALRHFAWQGLRSAEGLARAWFTEGPARALFAGMAAHSFLPLDRPPSAAFGLVLGMLGHVVGWPFARGGSRQIAEALAAHLRSLGGEIATRFRVESLDALPLARAVVLDVTPRQLIALAGAKLPQSYRERLAGFRYGPGVFKVDYALDWPIPWKNGACARAGTVHVGGSMEEIAQAEAEVAAGRVPERPFVILAQPGLFDETRAPEGCSTAWAYCHVPNGSAVDMTERIERQIERFAPGFRERILARRSLDCAGMEAENPNLVGGDISGGAMDWRQCLARPILSPTPYRTPVPGLYLGSASTPPGGGVHGMCGFHAAEAALRDLWRGAKPGGG